jgi:hypothetical protein
MPAASREPTAAICFSKQIQTGGSGRRKRVSARHQVKRPGRSFDRVHALSEAGAAEESDTGLLAFFIRCGSLSGSATSPAPASVRFGPDVFADALVPSRRVVAAFSPPIRKIDRRTRCRDVSAASRPAPLPPMVIGSPNRRVNRIPQIQRQSSKISIPAIPRSGRGASRSDSIHRDA